MAQSEPDPAYPGGARLVIASNRGPVEFQCEPHGVVSHRPGSGGLVNVIGPALAAHEGVWIAATMTEADREVAARYQSGVRPLRVEVDHGEVALRLVATDAAVMRSYYQKVATRILWPLHHHLLDPINPPRFNRDFPAEWRAYERVNEAFAIECAQQAAYGGTVLLQDYHLATAPALLRARRPDLRIAHFTMCPWAQRRQFEILPEWTRRRLVEGMLGAGMVSFLAPRWARAFMECCEALGYRIDPGTRSILGPDGPTAVRTYPVGVDVAALRERAARPEVREQMSWIRQVLAGRQLVIRVDRMEPAKNIVRGIQAYGRFLAAHPAWRERVVHYVLAYTSRAGLSEYQNYSREVQAAVAEVNERFGTDGWQPVILDTQNSMDRALALMAVADVLVVNPVRDGMNLVAKEAPAVTENDIVVILSREAGAADELAGGATIVDPFDIGELAKSIAEGLAMSTVESRRRLTVLRRAAGAMPPAQWLGRVSAELDDLVPAAT
jgi:trehalose 6-phosphate synthase